ncbi:hypothetical protein C0584_00415 [Candidatus Parcubacteria bacterium]|nr:MAG: hypothetical protein C0584_00415 [Candidatus Parcubacteria bacterium]
MTQAEVWEKEYHGRPQLITKHNEPQATFLRFLKFYKKIFTKDFHGQKAFDAGCGTGRNSNYLSKLGFDVYASDISHSAIGEAKKRAKENDLKIDYFVSDLSEKQWFEDSSFDLVIDVTSSNSLDEKGRNVFISEVHRILRPGGCFFVRALCIDGDKNAKNLVKNFPGPEYNTYKMPELGLIERVFSRVEFEEMYSKYFKILKIVKESGYTKFGNQSYKRNFLVAYLQKV